MKRNGRAFVAVRMSLLVASSAVLAWGCGADPEGSPSLVGSDGGAQDGAAVDAGTADSVAAADAAAIDAAGIDAAGIDVGGIDAGVADSATIGPDSIGDDATGGEADGSNSGVADAGAADAGVTDSVSTDAGSAGADVADTTAADAGAPDAGAQDTGAPDTGTPDTGTNDTGTNDTGAPDVGPKDAGVAAVCGDFVCAASESKAACAFDCSNTGKLVWPCIKSSCAAQSKKCQANQSCVAAVGAGLSCADACLTLDSACISKCQQALGANGDALAVVTCGVTKGCIASGPICGNGTCENGEQPLTCPLDCKTVCGDGKCELPETKFTCAKDCKPVFPACGDGTCAAGESAKTCAFDCDPATKKRYTCVKAKCPTQTATCLKQPACQTAVQAGLACVITCKKGDFGCLTGCGAKTTGNAAASAVVSCGLSCFF